MAAHAVIWMCAASRSAVRAAWNHPLNAGGRCKALLRVTRWQCASRLLASPVALPFIDGTYLFASRGMGVMSTVSNWYCGLAELSEMAFVLHALRKEDHFVDVGAHVGSYTVLAAGAVGAHVTAIEPIPATFSFLKLNIALNVLDPQVVAWRGGLSDQAGTLQFTERCGTANHVLVDGDNEAGTQVPVRTLDDLVRGDTPTVLKIDVEGQERSVLRGAVGILKDPRLMAVVMETNGNGARYGVEDCELFAILQEHGFSGHGYDPFARELRPVTAGSQNTIFVRDPTLIGARVRASRRYRLVNGTI